MHRFKIIINHYYLPSSAETPNQTPNVPVYHASSAGKSKDIELD